MIYYITILPCFDCLCDFYH